MKSLKVLNFGISGDTIENVMWRVKYGLLPLSIHTIIIHAGTNNISKGTTPMIIAKGSIKLTQMLKKINPEATIILTGLLPRNDAHYIKQIAKVSELLATLVKTEPVKFTKPDDSWFLARIA